MTIHRSVLAALTAAAFGLSALSVPAPAQAAQNEEQAEGTKDVLVFNNGRVLEGRIVEENDSQILFEGEVSGIPLKTTYQKSEILTIKRAAKGDTPADTPADKPAGNGKPVGAGSPAKPAKSDAPAQTGGPVIYVAELTGEFAADIHADPIRDLLDDAKKYEPDYLVIVLDNEWSEYQFDDSNDVGIQVNFDQYSYADELEPLFTTEIAQNWTKQPELVFWVKNAMGGAAFMPFFSRNIYFSPDGKIGGIGFIDDFFSGEEAFNEKQISLRLRRAEGMLIARGYEPMLIEAMVREPYVLSYRLEGGKPVYINRMPESEDEILLTDDGDGDNNDTVQQAVRGEDNDVLTLRAETARQLGVSKGTAADLDELIFELGIGRDRTIVNGDGERITENWSRALKAAQRQLPEMWQEFNEIQVGGDEREVRKARGRQISQLKQIIRLVNRFDGALIPQQFGVPGVVQLETLIEQIRLQNL